MSNGTKRPSSLCRAVLGLLPNIIMRTYLLLLLIASAMVSAFPTTDSMSSKSSNILGPLLRLRQQIMRKRSPSLQPLLVSSPTRLQLSDFEENNLSIAFNTTGRISGNNEEQDSVDAYLEFLDKRYRRIHCCDDYDEEDDSDKKKTSIKNMKKPFSAMDWLMDGKNKNESSSSNNNNNNNKQEQQRQTDDALYVLGLAGLASQKLLQKHHLSSTSSSSRFNNDDGDDAIIEINTDNDENEVITKESSMKMKT